MDERVVLRFRDGHTERALIDPIDNQAEALIVRNEDGTTNEVPFAALKAVFFPSAAVEPDAQLEQASGMQIAVEFSDGEVIRGAAHYNPERKGFFLFPADRTKNDRIFVVNSAIVALEVEKL
jgi:hypothetical protein